jgi:hypothetical protein
MRRFYLADNPPRQPPEDDMSDTDAPKLEAQPDLMPATAKDDPLLTPGAGGWTPGTVRNLVASCLTGAGGAIGTYLTTVAPGAPLDTRHMAGIAIVGCVTGAATFLGIRSAGTRKI